MVKKIILEPGRTFQEFSLLTGLTKKNCIIPNISLETRLAENLKLKIPMLSAAMGSVTGYDMALAMGKEGGIGILPARLPIQKQADIVSKIKRYEMSFVEEPLHVRETQTVEEVIDIMEKHGHSKIPVVDRNNYFLGLFDQKHYWTLEDISITDNVTKAMIPFDEHDGKITYSKNKDISVNEAKKLLKDKNAKHLIVLDEHGRLNKLAFEKDIEKVKVGSAISSYPGWEERVEANIAAGVDLIVIDSSDGYSEFVAEVIKEYKSMSITSNVPICAGNVITYDGALYLMEAGADIIKIGMSSGSICSTQREKATGRAPMTALIEVDRARRDYQKIQKSFKELRNRYVPLIADGGITSSADIIIALTVADAVMMGGYFNKFYEAAGEKLDKDGKPTRDESKMIKVVTYGEGSKRAQNLDRYGHSSRKTFFEEGIEGTFLYLGMLKPYLKKDIMKIKAALSNAGCMDLEEFRRESIIELNSSFTSEIVSKPHSVIQK